MDETQNKPQVEETTELPDIPESLRRPAVAVEKIPDVPVELEREFVSVEQEGGQEFQPNKE
jgi:hypothetical protein